LSRGKAKNCEIKGAQGTALTFLRGVPLRRPLKIQGAVLRDSPKNIRGQPLTFYKALQGVYFGGMAMIDLCEQKPVLGLPGDFLEDCHKNCSRGV